MGNMMMMMITMMGYGLLDRRRRLPCLVWSGLVWSAAACGCLLACLPACLPARLPVCLSACLPSNRPSTNVCVCA